MDRMSGRLLQKRQEGIVRAKSDFWRTARYGLTLQEHRVIYFVILAGQQNKTPFEPVDIAVKDFMEICELRGGSAYHEMKKLTQKIVSRTVEIVYKDDKGQHILQAPWLTSVFYHVREGIVSIAPNKELQPFFEGRPFSEMEYYYLVKFSSQYSERLYEVLKSLDNKPMPDFKIDDLKLLLGLKPDMYPNYANFRKRVLEPAIHDINEFTDLDVSIAEKRGYRNKIEYILFPMAKKNVPKLSKRMLEGAYSMPSPPLSEVEQLNLMGKLLGSDGSVDNDSDTTEM